MANSSLLMAIKEGDITKTQAAILELRDGEINEPITELDLVYAGETALHRAVATGRFDIVTLLLDANADANAKSRYNVTPLHIAAEKNGTEILSRAPQLRSDLRLPGLEFFAPALPNSSTAVNDDFGLITKALLNAGANDSIENWSHKTPRDIANEWGHTDLVDIFDNAVAYQYR